MENAFELAISSEIENFFCHLRDHKADRCDCDSLMQEAERLRGKLAIVQAEIDEVLGPASRRFAARFSTVAKTT